MDIRTEKAEMIRKFEQVHDIYLIRAIKNLLDFGLSKQDLPSYDEAVNEALEASIKQGLKESNEGKTRPHEEVMKEIRDRYKT